MKVKDQGRVVYHKKIGKYTFGQMYRRIVLFAVSGEYLFPHRAKISMNCGCRSFNF
jgi:hypothetical protein